MVDKPQKMFVGAYGRHSFGMTVVKQFNVAAFSPLSLKSNHFENIKYAQKKELLRIFLYKKSMLIRFVDSESSNNKGLYVRISVIGTTAPVNERY